MTKYAEIDLKLPTAPAKDYSISIKGACVINIKSDKKLINLQISNENIDPNSRFNVVWDEDNGSYIREDFRDEASESVYYNLIENNDYEGEEWNFYFKAPPSFIEMLKNEIPKNEDEIYYRIDSSTYSIEEIKRLSTQKSSTTYMHEHNLVGEINEEAFTGALEDETRTLYSILYKGGLHDFIRGV